MTNNIITAVGIDVSKGKSMIAIRHPGGEVLRIHRTEQPKQQKLKTIAATHSLFRVVQEVTGGEVWRGGSRNNGYPLKWADLALDVWLSLVSLVPLQVSVIKL